MHALEAVRTFRSSTADWDWQYCSGESAAWPAFGQWFIYTLAPSLGLVYTPRLPSSLPACLGIQGLHPSFVGAPSVDHFSRNIMPAFGIQGWRSHFTESTVLKVMSDILQAVDRAAMRGLLCWTCRLPLTPSTTESHGVGGMVHGSLFVVQCGGKHSTSKIVIRGSQKDRLNKNNLN